MIEGLFPTHGALESGELEFRIGGLLRMGLGFRGSFLFFLFAFAVATVDILSHAEPSVDRHLGDCCHDWYSYW